MSLKCCRRNDEDISDLQDLMMSFSGLGEKVLEHYTFAKVTINLLDSLVMFSLCLRELMHRH